MATSNNSKESLKLLIDTKEGKVLFAEASKNFVDFLFTLLAMPVGTIIRLLKKDGMIGSLGSLYESIEALSDTYIQSGENKDTVLKPVVLLGSQTPLLLPNTESFSGNLYTCQYYNGCRQYVSTTPNVTCPSCRNTMSTKPKFVGPVSDANATPSNEGGFVKGVVTYMVMDNLEVTPMSSISSITLLNKFNVLQLSALEERVVDIGMDEGLELLKASLHTSTVLSTVFLAKKNKSTRGD